MGQSTRLYGANISACTVGGTALVTFTSNVTINFEFDTQEAVALQDTWHYPVGIRRASTIEIETFVDTTGVLMTKAIAGVQIAFSITTGSGGNTYSGSGILTRSAHAIPDGPQTNSCTIVVQGVLTQT